MEANAVTKYKSHLSKLTVLNNKLIRIIQKKAVRRPTPIKDFYIEYNVCRPTLCTIFVIYNTFPPSFLHEFEFQILVFVRSSHITVLFILMVQEQELNLIFALNWYKQ